jgi:hypothetical protein
MTKEETESKEQRAYAVLLEDHIQKLKSLGVPTDQIDRKTLMDWLDNCLFNIEKDAKRDSHKYG